MAEHTKISWATHTWSPWIGCSKVASGCTNCYAEADFAIRRKKVVWGPKGSRVKTSDAYWKKPLRWNAMVDDDREMFRDCCYEGRNDPILIEPHHPKVFPSLCDPFEDWSGEIVDSSGERLDKFDEQWRPATMNDLRCDMFKLIDATPNLDWLLLSKRPENILHMWPIVEGSPYIAEAGAMNDYQLNRRENVWLIYSASDQESLEAGMRYLLKCRTLSPVLGLSLEPLLGPVNLKLATECDRNCNEYTYAECPGTSGPCIMQRLVDWVIVGGESGHNARPCALEWIDDIRRQCEAAKVPCFIKQMGSNPVTENANIWHFDRPGRRIGAAWGHGAAGCRINFDDSKGSDPSEWTEELRVQEFPNET